MAKLETVDASIPPPKKPAGKRKKTFKKKREKRVVHHGIVHVQASFNNTIITITDIRMDTDMRRKRIELISKQSATTRRKIKIS